MVYAQCYALHLLMLKANDHIYLPLLMEIRLSTVIVYVHENGNWPFQGLLILRNINMTLLRRILRETVFSGHLVPRVSAYTSLTVCL